MQPILIAAAAVAILLTAPDATLAQAADGHLVGIVLDQTGAAVPGCAVAAENVNTGVRWNKETDELGAYRFNNLPVGQYTLSAESEGFAPTILSGIAIALNRSTTLNVTLELAKFRRKSRSQRQRRRSTPPRRQSEAPSIPAKRSTAPAPT